MKILYFSWIKDKLGKSEENIILQEQIKTVEQLVIFLQNKNDIYKDIFKDNKIIKVSINMEVSNFNDSISDQDEIAFFPPMTGG